jgi:tetratricopeptide (TPR) repeat protein
MKWLKKAILIIIMIAATAGFGLQWISAIQFKQGMNFYENEDWFNAMKSFEQSSMLLSIHPEPHRLLGKTYLHLIEGRNSDAQLYLLRKAEKELLRAISIEDEYPYYWSILGRISELIEILGAAPEVSALSCYNQACRLDPTNSFFQELLAKHFIRTGMKEEAKEVMSKIAMTDSNSTMFVARFWLEHGLQADELIEIFSIDADALIKLAEFFRSRREYSEKAIKASKRAFEIDPQNIMALQIYGKCISDSKDCEKLKPIIEMPGLEEPARAMYASCLVRDRNFGRAEEEYLNLLEMNPKKPEYRWELARIYLREKSLSLAKTHLLWIVNQKEQEKGHIQTRAYIELARIFEKEGDLDQALKYYRLYLSQMPNDRRIQERVEKLENVRRGRKIISPWEIKK